ncbi:hypothetical protein Y032_0029g1924 [Ancylostoma ceylanicum]|uniref:Uncharacterized protein n=1 Tax=Ancylostoma ceylanicum TaxID=53326 RepID=A0A016USG1_9BILA|nr:hypothetical protein Y032_0029g1924 [Ancylostoma ceylanicum]
MFPQTYTAILARSNKAARSCSIGARCEADRLLQLRAPIEHARAALFNRGEDGSVSLREQTVQPIRNYWAVEMDGKSRGGSADLAENTDPSSLLLYLFIVYFTYQCHAYNTSNTNQYEYQ